MTTIPQPDLEAWQSQTLAAQFVDDITFLRVLGVRIPQADPKTYGADATSIVHRYAEHVTDVWDYAPEDTYIHWRRFTDGSQAVLLRGSERWEVFVG